MGHVLRHWPVLALLLLGGFISACDRRIYVKDGVTDGDRFSLPPYVYASDDPVLQSWVAYGLARSVCQLEMGGPNPARNMSFDCELTAREALVTRWRQSVTVGEATPSETYLNALLDTADAGYLDEYVWHYLRRRDWTAPEALDLEGFSEWRTEVLTRRHKPETRIVGSWGYALTSD